jgi:hypothetical protein
MHLKDAGATPEVATKPCERCGAPFAPKRPWARFCGSACRNDFHGAEARKEAMRTAAPELLEALLMARQAMRGKDMEQIWINYPVEPALTLGAKIDQVLAKAGHKEPKPA